MSKSEGSFKSKQNFKIYHQLNFVEKSLYQLNVFSYSLISVEFFPCTACIFSFFQLVYCNPSTLFVNFFLQIHSVRTWNKTSRAHRFLHTMFKVDLHIYHLILMWCAHLYNTGCFTRGWLGSSNISKLQIKYTCRSSGSFYL